MHPSAAVAYRLLSPRTTLTELINIIVAPINDSALCFVSDEQSLYVLDKESLAVVNPPLVVATSLGPSVKGRWFRYFPVIPPPPFDYSILCTGPIVDGAFREVLPEGALFPATVTWWDSPAKNQRLMETTYAYNAQNLPETVTTAIYGSPDRFITDVITYDGMIESTRTRSVS